MKFRNTRTGAVLELPENFSGKYWEPVEAPKPEKKAAAKKAAAKKKSTAKK